MAIDSRLKKDVLELREGMLGDNPSNWTCGMVCFALQGFLYFALGLETCLYEGDLGEMNHIWMMLPDGRVLDPTADQFNFWFPHKKYPKVHLGKMLDIHENAKPCN